MTEQVQNPPRLRSPRIVGTTDQHVIEQRLLKAMRRAKRTRSPHGLTNPTFYLTLAGYEQLTPHCIKVRKARRVKNKIAKQSRKANR